MAAVALAFVAALVLAASALAAPGDLDSTFASSGIYTGAFPVPDDGAYNPQSVAVDSQGRVLLASTDVASSATPTPRDIKVVRLTPQGVLDTSFGSGGTATLSFPGASDVYSVAVRVDSLDRVVVAGTANSASPKIALARLTSAGQPDLTFDGDGYLVSGLPAGPSPRPEDLAIDASGGLLVAGTAESGCPPAGTQCIYTGFAARFTATGVIDATYGTGGWQQIGAQGDRVQAIVALPGGGAFVTGFDYSVILVARLTATGALDTSFGSGGIATTDMGKAKLDLVSDYGLAVDSSGRPTAVGQLTVNNGGARAVLARFTTTGAQDASFGDGSPATGTVALPATVNGRLTDAAVQCDGNVLATGFGGLSGSSGGNEVLLTRVTDAGVLDTTFAAGSAVPGVAFTPIGDYAIGANMTLAGNGALVAGFGGTFRPFKFNPVVLRYEAPAACPAGAPPAGGAPAPGTPAPGTPGSVPPGSSPPPASGAASAERIRLVPSPARVAVGRRTCVQFTATVAGRRLAGALVRFAGNRRTTNRNGRATICARFGRVGSYRARASRAGLRDGLATVKAHALRARHRPRPQPHFTG